MDVYMTVVETASILAVQRGFSVSMSVLPHSFTINSSAARGDNYVLYQDLSGHPFDPAEVVYDLYAVTGNPLLDGIWGSVFLNLSLRLPGITVVAEDESVLDLGEELFEGILTEETRTREAGSSG